MTCSTCRDFYLVPSNTPQLCIDCEHKAIQSAAKEPDEKSESYAGLGSWLFADRVGRQELKKGKVI